MRVRVRGGCVCACVRVESCRCQSRFLPVTPPLSPQGNIQTAAKLTSRLYRKVLVPGLESVMESDKKVKQSSLSEKMEKALDNLEKYGIKVDPSLCLYCVQPVVQSGGAYNLDIINVKP